MLGTGDLEKAYEMTTPEIAEKLSIAGTPEECVAKIKEMESAGVNHMILCITDPYILKLFAQREVDVPGRERPAPAHRRRGHSRLQHRRGGELGSGMTVTSEQTLTEEQRATFWALADVLIPATDAMPAASEAGSAEKWLDRALAARPDLVDPLAAVLDGAAGKDPEAEARRLHADDPDGFSTLAQIASGGYYMNLKIRKRIGYPGQGKRPPFSDEAEYDLRDGLLDPVYARGPINTTPPPPPDPVEPAAPLPFCDLGNGDGSKADVLVIGAGAGGSVAARHLAEAGFKVVCLEQGGWENASDFPGDKLEWELVSDAQWSPNPNTRQHPSDYPLEVSGSPITPVMYNAVGGSTIHFCAQWVRLRPQDYKLRTLHGHRRRLADLLRGDEAVLRADRPGDADLRHGRRPELPAGPAAAPAAAPDRRRSAGARPRG